MASMIPRYKISIVTPAFNAAATIERTIESVLAQGDVATEYWIIDGGSTDGTLDIVRRYEGRLAGWISEKDRGISDAFNKGIARTTGDLVGIINADDWYEPGALAAVHQAHAARIAVGKPAAILHGDMNICSSSSVRRNRPRVWGGAQGIGLAVYFDMPVNHPTCFVPRSLYERIGGYGLDFKIAMDVDFIIRAWQAGAEFEYLDRVLANFQVGGVSTQHTRKALDEVWRAQRNNRLAALPCWVSYLGKLAVNQGKALLRH